MKQIILMGTGIFVLLITTLILISLQGRQIRQTKLDNGVTELMEAYMEQSYYNREIKTQSDEKCKQWFQTGLQERISEEGEFDVKVLNRDMSIGLLSLAVVERYHHVTGSEGSISIEKTILQEEEQKQTYRWISFSIPKELANQYRIPTLVERYTVSVGEGLNCPKAPDLDGLRFCYWKENATGSEFQNEEINELTVGLDSREFVAVYE